MARYQVWILKRPETWQPASADDVPPEPGQPVEVLAETGDFLAALGRAVEHNAAADRREDRRWAAVVDPTSRGQIWPTARLCTPVAYKLAAVWWPAGWEPDSPLDVPQCAWKTEAQAAQDPMSRQRALATARALNRQSTDHAASMWYVVVAVENEPTGRTVSYDSSGTETAVGLRPLHVVRPDEGGKGDCSRCPAHALDCAAEAGI